MLVFEMFLETIKMWNDQPLDKQETRNIKSQNLNLKGCEMQDQTDCLCGNEEKRVLVHVEHSLRDSTTVLCDYVNEHNFFELNF